MLFATNLSFKDGVFNVTAVNIKVILTLTDIFKGKIIVLYFFKGVVFDNGRLLVTFRPHPSCSNAV